MPVCRRGSSLASTYDVMLVQDALRAVRLYDGPVDGVPGAKTRLALRKYKRRHGLAVDDTFDEALLAHVRESV